MFSSAFVEEFSNQILCRPQRLLKINNKMWTYWHSSISSNSFFCFIKFSFYFKSEKWLYSRTCLKDHLYKMTTHKSTQVLFGSIYSA